MPERCSPALKRRRATQRVRYAVRIVQPLVVHLKHSTDLILSFFISSDGRADLVFRHSRHDFSHTPFIQHDVRAAILATTQALEGLAQTGEHQLQTTEVRALFYP